jgi:hypothetical protein
MNIKIISGGQTGADVASLWAAKLFNIPTGGWAPKSFITTAGNHPEMAETFNMREHPSSYRDRTIANLQDANLTIICSEKMSAGTRLTINQCIKQKKPYYVFWLDSTNINKIDEDTFIKMRSFIKNSGMIHENFVLNVAGNSTKNSPRAFEFTFRLCYRLFAELGYTSILDQGYWNTFKDRWQL